MTIRTLNGSLLLLPLALAACTSGKVSSGAVPKTASSGAVSTPEKPAKFNKDPYPSTYKSYPSTATAIRGVTIFDGEGGQIDNGVILFADGKVSGVGGADITIPAGATIIDGKGKFLTHGIIYIHSQLSDYPSPSVQAHSGRHTCRPCRSGCACRSSNRS